MTQDLEYPSLDDPNTGIIDSGTSHTILKQSKYFDVITPSSRSITTIAGPNNIEEGKGNATIILPGGTKIIAPAAIYAPKATQNLISFQDIRANNFQLRTNTEGKTETLQIIQDIQGKPSIKETFALVPPGLYAANIQSFNIIQGPPDTPYIWHCRLGHPGTTMYNRIIRDSIGIQRTAKPKSKSKLCLACSQGKLTIRPAVPKTIYTIPKFLEQINADICGPIDPPSGPFKYFLVLIDSSTKWLQISLLSTINLAFSRILSHILKLKARFP